MYIVPYTYLSSKSPVGEQTYHTIDLLVQGGTALWEEAVDEASIPDLLASNDLVVHPLFVSNQVAYVKVDTARTNMASMYRWTEVLLKDKDTLCWRRFNHITQKGAEWLSFCPEPFGPLLERIIEREAKGHLRIE